MHLKFRATCHRKGFLHNQNYVRCLWLLYGGKHYWLFLFSKRWATENWRCHEIQYYSRSNFRSQGAYHSVKKSLFGVILVCIFPGFSRIRTEYGKILRSSPYSVRMWENSEKNQTRITPNTDSFYAVYRKYIADLEQRKAMEDAIKWDKEKTKNGAKKISRR